MVTGPCKLGRIFLYLLVAHDKIKMLKRNWSGDWGLITPEWRHRHWRYVTSKPYMLLSGLNVRYIWIQMNLRWLGHVKRRTSWKESWSGRTFYEILGGSEQRRERPAGIWLKLKLFMELTNHSLKKYFPLRRKDKSYWRFDSRLVSPQAPSTNCIHALTHLPGWLSKLFTIAYLFE